MPKPVTHPEALDPTPATSQSRFAGSSQRGIALVGSLVFGLLLLIAGAALLSVAGNSAWMAERAESADATMMGAENGLNLVLAYLQSAMVHDKTYPVGVRPLAPYFPSSTVQGIALTETIVDTGGVKTVTVTASAPANSGVSDVILACDILWDTAAVLVRPQNWRVLQW